MQSYEAIRRAVNGHHEAIAKAVGRSANLVYRWTLPTTDYSDSGAYSDLDRLESLIDRSLALGTPTVDALAPVHHLALRFGGIFLPPVPRVCRLTDISRQLAKTMKEVSEAFATAAKALEDDKLTPNERREILAAAHEGLHELTTLIGMIEGKHEG